MTTNDIDAIRKDASRLVQLLGRAGDHPAAVAFRANDLASGQVPALCDEIEQLRAELAKARRERDEYAADNTRVAVSLVDVQRQLTAANHHTDNLAADVRDMQKANTAYANENARLRSKLADADVVIASMRAAIDEADEAEVAQ